MKSQLQQVYPKAKEYFLKFDGVVGVGLGPKISHNEEVSPEAIIVFVEKKLQENEVAQEQIIPPIFEGFPTDVREPKLNIKSGKDFDPNTPPGLEDECLTDYLWIDWQKINELNQKQKGKSNNDNPTKDEPADLPTT